MRRPVSQLDELSRPASHYTKVRLVPDTGTKGRKGIGMIGLVLTLGVGVLHLYILWLEMFAWEAPRTRAAFGTTPEFAAATRVLAANQGLYNGFLAAGLFWAAVSGLPGAGIPIAAFFLTCVIVAGLYGGATASRRIIFVQALPAGLALASVLLGI